MHHDDCNLGDPIVAGGVHSGRFHVHHRKRTFVEKRRALCGGDKRPAAVGLLSHARIGAEKRRRDPFGHTDRGVRQAEHLDGKLTGRRRAELEQLERALDERTCRMCGETDHRVTTPQLLSRC